jgi:hypothetical protein
MERLDYQMKYYPKTDNIKLEVAQEYSDMSRPSEIPRKMYQQTAMMYTEQPPLCWLGWKSPIICLKNNYLPELT